ncbi:MAG: HD domain-containing protein [Smithellaceae bacterium]|nr:HD domain-containing protein [Smithellaceae bacterium]
MKKSIYVKDIQAGQKVADTFLVAEKSLAFSQKGSPYLNLKLKDKTGEMEAKIWENALEWDKLFKKGDIISLVGRALSYRNALQLSVLEVSKTDEGELDISNYFPTAAVDNETMFSELLTFVDKVEDTHLRALLDLFFRDEAIAGRFRNAPAAKGFHHVYIGGLLEHTLSVVRLLDMVADHYRGSINRDLLLAGGLLHDIGKIQEFTYQRLIDYSDEGRLIGHIVIGLEMLDEKIATLPDFLPQLALELRHLILSHHGTLEFGSPKRPKTVEALIVHFIDDLDAKVNAFQGFIENSSDEESSWTPFHRLFERYIYKGK